MLENGDLLYYKYPNGVTVIIGYDPSIDGKNIPLHSLNSSYMLEKVVRNGKVLWERNSNNTSSGPTN